MINENSNIPVDYRSIVLDKIVNDKNFLKELSTKQDLDAMYEYTKNVVGDHPKEDFLYAIKEVKNIVLSETSLENVNGGNLIGKIIYDIQQFIDNGGEKLVKSLSKF